MDLALSPEYEAFREEVRAFLDAHKDDAPSAHERGPRNPRMQAWQTLLIENGYAARTIPKEYGGYGAAPDILKSRIIAEEFARAGFNCRFGDIEPIRKIRPQRERPDPSSAKLNDLRDRPAEELGDSLRGPSCFGNWALPGHEHGLAR